MVDNHQLPQPSGGYPEVCSTVSWGTAMATCSQMHTRVAFLSSQSYSPAPLPGLPGVISSKYWAQGLLLLYLKLRPLSKVAELVSDGAEIHTSLPILSLSLEESGEKQKSLNLKLQIPPILSPTSAHSGSDLPVYCPSLVFPAGCMSAGLWEPATGTYKLPDGKGPVTCDWIWGTIRPSPAGFKGVIMGHPGNNTFHGKDRNYGVLSK